MGLSGSKGSVHVCVDKADYAPGEVVSGLVYLYLRKRVKTDTLWLKVKCTEETYFSSTRKATKHWLRQRFPLGKWSKEVPAGSHSFPFHLALPTNLPCSFKFASNRVSASITCKIKAEIGGKKSHITHSILLPIRPQALQQPGIRAEAVSSTASCCVSRGEVRLIAGFEKACYSSEETPEVIVEVDNSKGKIVLSGVNVSLCRVLKVRDNRGKADITRQQLTSLHHSQRIPGKQGLLTGQALVIPLPLDVYRASLSETPTVTGEFIECKYLCEVSLEVKGYCKPTIPRSVIVPIDFVSGQPASLPVPEPPDDWSPTLYPNTDFTIGSQYDYQPSAPPAEH